MIRHELGTAAEDQPFTAAHLLRPGPSAERVPLRRGPGPTPGRVIEVTRSDIPFHITITRPPSARRLGGESRRRLRPDVAEYGASTPLGCSGRRRSAARWTSTLGCLKMCRPPRRTPSLGGHGGWRLRRRVILARPVSYGLAWRIGRRRARVLTSAEAVVLRRPQDRAARSVHISFDVIGTAVCESPRRGRRPPRLSSNGVHRGGRHIFKQPSVSVHRATERRRPEQPSDVEAPRSVACDRSRRRDSPFSLRAEGGRVIVM